MAKSVVICFQILKPTMNKCVMTPFTFYSGTSRSYLTNLLSLTLVGVVGAGINMRSSYSQRGSPVV